MSVATKASATIDHATGKVVTGRKGKYAVLGWKGDIQPRHQGAMTIMPEYSWEDNEVVAVCRTLREAKNAALKKSKVLGIGDGEFYLLSIYKNS